MLAVTDSKQQRGGSLRKLPCSPPIFRGYRRGGASIGASLCSFKVQVSLPTPVSVSDAAKRSKNELLHNKEERIPQTEELR